MPETDNPHNMNQNEANSTVVINGKVLGNTQYIAQLIGEKTGGGIFRIVPQDPYPTDHKTLVDMAKIEQINNKRPPIMNTPDISKYDIIFLGYPNWWADMPMVIYTFLEQNDLSGKTIIPFCTHGGSGFSDTIGTIKMKQPEANIVKNGYAISRTRMEQAPKEIDKWLNDIKQMVEMDTAR